MKLKPTGAQTVEDYLAQIDEPRRSDVEKLHTLISKAVPKLKPGVQGAMIGYGTYHYKYATGREGDAPVIALASNKQYISVYVCGVKDGEYVAERRKSELPKASIGKSCIRFKRVEDIDAKALVSIIKEGAQAVAAMYKTAGAGA